MIHNDLYRRIRQLLSTFDKLAEGGTPYALPLRESTAL